MRVEPILSLALSMQAGKGTYALLLGSGVSRSAKIPTGWEVTVDLTRKLAKLKGQNCDPEPEAWYRAAFGEDPDYAQLLEQIGKTPAERRAILRGYFEASEEQRLRGEKVPTQAHRCIADLVSKGYIRVIITTNFDHLIEDALRGDGIEPVILSTPDAVEGAPPLSQVNTLIVKAHGDYLDTRLKNTTGELSHYDERLDRLLDRVFDEFGLVVCGWSATWDVAMRGALERCKGHRYTTFWTRKSPLADESTQLVRLRQAQVIDIEGSDEFFRELSSKVFSLEEIGRPHPLETKVAVSTLKRCLQESHSEMLLNDFVGEETEHLYERLIERNYPVSERTPGYANPDASHIVARLKRYEAECEILVSLFVTGCYWAGREHDDLWWKCLERIANPRTDFPNPFSGFWFELRRYPALLLLYAGGVAATARRQHSTLVKLLTSPTVSDFGSDEKRLLVLVNSTRMLKDLPSNVFKEIFQVREVYGASHRLAETLRNPFRGLLPQDRDYDYAFDRFEHFLALAYADMAPEMAKGWTPIGRWHIGKASVLERVTEEAAEAGDDWEPLKAGLFGGAKERHRAALQIAQRFYRTYYAA